MADSGRLDPNRAAQLWLREDDLINHRLTWFGVTQGLMFGAYGIILNDADCRERCVAAKSTLPWAGLSLSGLVTVGIVAAILATIKIYALTDDPHKRFGITAPTTICGWLCALGIPVVFGLLWVNLIMVGPGEMTPLKPH